MNTLSTAERLLSYHQFSDSVIEDVAEAADWQNRYTYSELFSLYNIGDSYKRVEAGPNMVPLEVLEFTPKGDFDEKHAVVSHLSMGKSINHRMAMNAMRVFSADPSKRMILIGNPSLPGHTSGKTTGAGALAMMMANTLRPVVRPTLHYLRERGITRTDHYGYSYGADKAAAAVADSHYFDQKVSHGVFVEPVSAERQSPLQLLGRFRTIGSRQQEYIDQANSQPYDEILEGDRRRDKLAYAAGLCRLSNIAITKVLASGGYDYRLRNALDNSPSSVITTAWGTESELSDDAILRDITDCAREDYGHTRVKTMELDGMHHLGGYDLDLSTAIVLQGLRN